MSNQLMFVQFPHPGPEHQPSSSIMPWSPLLTAAGKPVDHARKFLRVRGSYLVDGILEDGEVACWGEWEPPSRVLRLPARRDGYPNWLHTPTIRPIPDGPRQNTDPLVFGECFLYSNCRQSSNANLRQLATGSLIVFGSKQPDRNEFILDTVFVVGAGAIDYVVEHSEQLDVPEWVHEVVFRALRSGEGCQLPKDTLCRPGDQLRLYRGRAAAHPPDGPFSFVPCRPWVDIKTSTFPRPVLRLPERLSGEPWLNPNQWRAARCVLATAEELHTLWSEIVEQLTRAGLYLGVRFEPPEYDADR
jgi:hypothetical protein